MLKLAISGAAGRMGARLIDLGNQNDNFQIVDAVDSANHPKLGQDIGSMSGIGPINVPLAATYENSPAAVIDFSVPAGADQARMQQVAEIGGGNHYHADTGAQLVDVFREIANNLPTIVTK